MIDENVANDNWVEAAWESFEEALDNKDWETASLVIFDTKDNGFEEDAEKMKVKMSEVYTEEPVPMDERDLADRDYPRE